MSDYGVADFQRAAAELDRQLSEALAEADQRKREHEARMAALQTERDEALSQLVQVILPSWSPEALMRAGRVAGFGEIMIPQQTQGGLERERADLTARLAQIAADPRFVDRVRLRAPRVGTLVRELEELEEFERPLAELMALAEHPRLSALLESGYGTDAYAVPWWRLSYYADWKAGDELLERFPGKKSFAELRPEIIAARDGLAVYRERIGDLRREIVIGEELEREHQSASERLANLELAHLRKWQEKLARHMVNTDLTELGDRLDQEEAARLLAKTYAGLTKKQAYLLQVFQAQVEQPLRDLRAEREKLRNDRIKFARPKKSMTRFPGDKFEKRFFGRRERFQKHWRRYDHTSGTLFSFTSYERASFAENFLWWDLFTDGQIDGNFIPEVREFHSHHPGYAWRGGELDESLADRAAQAALDADQAVGAGGASFRDPS